MKFGFILEETKTGIKETELRTRYPEPLPMEHRAMDRIDGISK